MQNATPDGPPAGIPPTPSSRTPVAAPVPPVTVSDAAVVKRMYEESVESYEASITPEELAKPLYTVSVLRLAARAAAAAAATTSGDGSAEAPPAGLRLLDVGCGPGHVLEILSRGAGGLAAAGGVGEAPSPPPPPPTLIGVDLSPRMVARARARVPGATVIEGSVLDVAAAVAGVPGGGVPFDGLACLFVLHHVGDLRAVLGGFRRLLRPGGAVLLASWVSTDGARMEGYPEQWPIDAVAHRVEVVNAAAAAAGLRVDAVEETEDEDMGARYAVWECTAVAVEGI